MNKPKFYRPAVVSDIPIGPAPPKRAKPPAREPSPRIELLQSLKIGDSFISPGTEKQTYVTYARKLGLPIAWRNIGGYPTRYRIWRVKEWEVQS